MTGGALVAAVGEVQHGELLGAQEVQHVHRVFPGGAEAVHGDHPGVAVAGDEPGGQGAQLAGDLDVLVIEAEAAEGVAAVQLRGEADPGARFQAAACDPLQAAYDGVGGAVRCPVEDGSDDGVGVAARQPVRAGAQGGEGAGQGDLSGRGGVHGESAVAGEGARGASREGGVAGVAAGRDRCRADAEDRGDGRCRRFCRAHRPSLAGRGPRCQRAGPYGARPSGRPRTQPGCP